MRTPPEFPVWKAASPPPVRRWLAAAALTALLTGSGSLVLWNAGNGHSVTLIVMLLSLAVIAVLWLCRLLYFRASVHHATAWNRAVEDEHRQWWDGHKSQLALCDILLIGPAGSESIDWIRVLNREQRPPEERQEAGGKAFRIARSFSSDIAEREQQLARSLVLKWKKERQTPLPSLAGCFWLGSDSAWQAFSSQMHASFPEALVPESPSLWKGEETLSRLVMSLQSDEKRHFLVAGCYSGTALGGTLPAGESAVLWLVGASGPVMLARGEFFDSDSDNRVEQVFERALTQSELEAAPDTCILFSHPGLPELASCGWNITHHLQDKYWGYTGEMQPLVVISLAAILAQHQKQPCGWLATDPKHTLALGIVKPHGNG